MPWWGKDLHIALLQVHLVVHVFQLSEEGAADDGDGTEEAGSIYREWMLPAREFHSMWDALLYEDDIKSRLLRYATTVRTFQTPAAHTMQHAPLAKMHAEERLFNVA